MSFSRISGARRTIPTVPMRVLIVEDDSLMAATLKRGLEEEHHTVTAAADGDAGLALAQTYDFDVGCPF